VREELIREVLTLRPPKLEDVNQNDSLFEPLTSHRASRSAAGKALRFAPPSLGETRFTDLLDNPDSG
jgi:hypothetical protein